MSTESAIQMQVLSRFAKLPIINSAIGFATDGYSRIKSYNSLLSSTLSKAEQSIIYVATTAKPVIEKFEKPISIADNIACQGLDKLEEKVPALKKSPEEIKDETKKLFEGSVSRIEDMRKFGNDKLRGMKVYGVNKVNGVLDSPYIRAFLKSIDTAIDLTHNAVDHYLPAVANEPKFDENESQQSLVVRMSHLSDKMRRRMYNQLLSKWLPMFFVTFDSLKANLFSWNHSNDIQENK
jgi:perilipin-2